MVLYQINLDTQGNIVTGIVKNLYISKKANGVMVCINSAVLVSGKGIEGDRYYEGTGTFSEKLKGNPASELTLIEKEEIDKFNKEQNLNLHIVTCVVIS